MVDWLQRSPTSGQIFLKDFVQAHLYNELMMMMNFMFTHELYSVECQLICEILITTTSGGFIKGCPRRSPPLCESKFQILKVEIPCMSRQTPLRR